MENQEIPKCSLPEDQRVNLIGGYIAGTLSAEDKDFFEQHAVGCEDCRKILAVVLQAAYPEEEQN